MALCQGQRRVVGRVALDTHIDDDRASGLQLDTTRAEDGLQRSHAELHIQEVERITVLVLGTLGILLTIVFHHRTPEVIVAILVGTHDERGDNIIVAQAGVYHIAACLRIKLDNRRDVGGILQVGGIFAEALHIVIGARCGGLDIVVQVQRGSLLLLSRWARVGGRWRRRQGAGHILSQQRDITRPPTDERNNEYR